MPTVPGEIVEAPRRGRPPLDRVEQAKREEQNRLRNRAIDKDSEEIAKKRLLPLPPGKQITWDEMQAWLKPLTPEMWNHLSIYVYREFPRIIRQLKDPNAPKYIDILTGPFDMDYMIRNHGGGKYGLMAVDTDTKPGTKDNRLFECDFEISMGKHEPKLNYEELDVNAKPNMAYVGALQYKGILDSKGQVMQQPAPAAAAGTGPNSEIIKQVLDFLGRQETSRAAVNPAEQSITKSIGDILVEKIKQDDPSKTLGGLASIIKEFSPNKSPDTMAGSIEKMMEMQMTMQREQATNSLAMMDKLIDARQNTPNPQVEQMNQMLEFAERLSGFARRGSAAGAERTGWDVGLDYARELGVPLLQTIGNLINLNRGGAPMMPVTRPPAANPAAPVSGAFDPYANPEAMRTLAQAAAGAGQAPAPPPGATEAPAAGAPNDLTTLVRVYGGLLVTHLNNGTPGWEFADNITRLVGMASHAQISAQGEEALTRALLSFPDTAQFGPAHLQKFVHEFIHFQDFLEQPGEDEDEPEPEEIPVGVKA